MEPIICGPFSLLGERPPSKVHRPIHGLAVIPRTTASTVDVDVFGAQA